MSNADVVAEQKQQDLIDVGEMMRWVTFRLVDEVYAVNVLDVQEVLRSLGTEITPVPGSPRHVKGIINLRGKVVTVVDTRMLFGLVEKEQDDSSRVIIVESEKGQVAGMIVDSVSEVILLRESDIEAKPHIGTEESAKYISGVVYKDDMLHILVDMISLFSTGDLNSSSSMF